MLKKRDLTQYPLIDTSSNLDKNLVVGIIGDGQLGRMLVLAAARLGVKCRIYSSNCQGCAISVADNVIQGCFTDFANLDEFANGVDVITYESENISLPAVKHLSKKYAVYPPAHALEISQDRLAEKKFLKSLDVNVTAFQAVSSEADFLAAVQRIGTPSILKTRFLGYDGKGQVELTANSELSATYSRLSGSPAILEKKVDFEYEISVILVRGLNSLTSRVYKEKIYDIPANTHEKGILKRSIVPAPIDDNIRLEAKAIACKIANALNYVGILAVELFVVRCGKQAKLLVNEISPRVHNTGHWTMDACVVDQFENHIRAILGWPIGNTDRYVDVEMVNILGSEIYQLQSFLPQSKSCIHLYGKETLSPLRKMGHINKIKSFS